MDKLQLAKQKLAELVEHSSNYHDGGQKQRTSMNWYSTTAVSSTLTEHLLTLNITKL